MMNQMKTPVLLAANNICFTQGKKQILQNVSMGIGANDFITIVGPNGAGKTSLVKILLGLVQPTSGEVITQDKLRIGYLSQSLRLASSMPINVRSFLSLSGCTASQINSALKQVDINHLAKRQIHSLSNGESQRVLLARAIIKCPQLLILDEPTQNLDMANQAKFYQLLDQIYQQSNTSIIMISHDLHLVMKDTKQVICLFGHICCQGKPQAIAQDPKFVQMFGHEFAQSVAWYQHNATQKCEHKHDK